MDTFLIASFIVVVIFIIAIRQNNDMEKKRKQRKQRKIAMELIDKAVDSNQLSIDQALAKIDEYDHTRHDQTAWENKMSEIRKKANERSKSHTNQ